MFCNKKRVACRAIIFKDDKLLTMYRERDGRKYFTFPGGGREGSESLESCVIREVYEEFGIIVEPIKKVYLYSSKSSIQHFFLCTYINGEFGSGTGEEFQENNPKGVYIPTPIDIDKISEINLEPSKIKDQLIEDIAYFGQELKNKCNKIKE